MTVDEAWTQLRTRLVELVGVSGAEILMDRPPGGWGDLVTNHTLDLRFAAWEERFAADRKQLGAAILRRCRRRVPTCARRAPTCVPRCIAGSARRPW